MGLFFSAQQSKMTDRSSESKRGFGRGRGGRGRGRGGAPKPAQKDGSGAWVPVTKLGRLVKDRHITSLEHIYRYALPIKESQIIDYFLPSLKDEVVKITPVQKQTTAGQRTRFKAFVVVGDGAGHLGLGVKCLLKLLLQSVVQLSLQNFQLFQSEKVIGVTRSVHLTPSHLKLLENVDLFP